ncbi:MAG TPA: trypsin-like peptidase domain-containing protein [Myxococcales bacterium]|nr:trypsin-like peptidase domain-containing protein [Myxococcales bacterium]
MIGFALVALLVSAGPDPLEEAERAQQEIFNRVAPGVVFISNGEWFGSGFFISPDGLILTNAHVVKGASSVKVVLYDGRTLAAEVVERGADDIDVALVQAKLSAAPALPLDDLVSVKIGSWVGAVGHGHGAIWTFNTGMISNIYPDGAERPVFQTQIPLNPGNSGGPIFNRSGRVVGIVTAGIENASSINFGIAMGVVRRSLSKLAHACDCISISAPKGVPIFVNGVMSGTGPRIVIPATAGKPYDVFAVVAGQMRRARATFPADREIVLK